MLDNDNSMSVYASEAVEKIPTGEKVYHKCPLRVIRPQQIQ